MRSPRRRPRSPEGLRGRGAPLRRQAVDHTIPWNQFTTQINGVTLSNAAGRLAAVATSSNGAWQLEVLSYYTDGTVAARYIFTQSEGRTALWTGVNTSVSYTRDLRDQITRRWPASSPAGQSR